MSRHALETALAAKSSLFSPFFLLGDPTPAISYEILRACLRAGAPMLELGFAYSDPVADGPAIQHAAERTRAAGASVDDAFRLLARLRAQTDTPFNLLVYANLLHARRASRFCRDAAAAGASSLLVPDCPFEENSGLADAAHEAGLAFCNLVGPATSAERIRLIATRTSGFLYRTGRQGVTGRRGAASDPEDLAATVAASPHPICVGFGLEAVEHLEAVWSAGALIAVVGSAFARQISSIERGLNDLSVVKRLVENVESRVREAVAAARALDASQPRKGH